MAKVSFLERDGLWSTRVCRHLADAVVGCFQCDQARCSYTSARNRKVSCAAARRYNHTRWKRLRLVRTLERNRSATCWSRAIQRNSASERCRSGNGRNRCGQRL